jgi:hypothetical protein
MRAPTGREAARRSPTASLSACVSTCVSYASPLAYVICLSSSLLEYCLFKRMCFNVCFICP